jgi:methylated-DNA-protein-cysteine methyltransferase-like protein
LPDEQGWNILWKASREATKGEKAMSNTPSSFSDEIGSLMARVFAVVRACPAGRVTTYGWIAKAIGYPRGARMVGMIMHESVPGVPAQRVINSKGELSGSWAFGEPDRMRQLLEDEGIVFSAEDRVDLKRYGWDPLRDLAPEELQQLLESEIAQEAVAVSPGLLQQLRRDPASPFRSTSTK